MQIPIEKNFKDGVVYFSCPFPFDLEIWNRTCGRKKKPVTPLVNEIMGIKREVSIFQDAYEESISSSD